MTEETDGPTHSASAEPIGQIVTQHPSRSFVERSQASAQAKKGRLSGTVRTLQQHDLTRIDGEIGAGEGGKSAEQCDGVPKCYNRTRCCSIRIHLI
jgi:hypothetical protein